MCTYGNLSTKELYRIVFDADGAVRPCGREACKALMQRFEVIFPGVDFGNMQNGQMDIDVIQVCMEHVIRIEHPDICLLEENLYKYAGFYLVDKTCDEKGRVTDAKYRVVTVPGYHSGKPVPKAVDVADDAVQRDVGFELHVLSGTLTLHGDFDTYVLGQILQLMEHFAMAF